jgi:hypothetical protein
MPKTLEPERSKYNMLDQSNRRNDQGPLMPAKRPLGFNDILYKKPKTLPVSYQEWEPFSQALLSLEFEAEDMTETDIKERKAIAAKISTPEGLADIINDLEAKLAYFEDVPLDPHFEKLSVTEKIQKLFDDFYITP